MSCPYYWWNHNYACRKTGKDVSEDVYYKYCRNYDYSDCPIYKQERPSDSSCYLTTACIRARNLPDDCEELTTLRWFRDNYLNTFAEGHADILRYYEVAPQIVEAIEKLPNAAEVFEEIYQNYILQCVELVKTRCYSEAHKQYRELALLLEQQYFHLKKHCCDRVNDA